MAVTCDYCGRAFPRTQDGELAVTPVMGEEGIYCSFAHMKKAGDVAKKYHTVKLRKML